MDNGRTAICTYDTMERLSTAVTDGATGYPKWGLSWVYDRYGNRPTQTPTFDAPPGPNYAVSATTNRITSSGYTYDAAGNMTNDGVKAFTFDAENRIKTVNTTAATYTHDAHNHRVKKVAGSTTSIYIYSKEMGNRLIAEYSGGSLVRDYIYSGATLLASVDSGGTVQYHHSDHLSVRVTSDTSGTIIGQQGHYPFGEGWYSSSSTTKWEFTNYERDSESGLNYATFRHDIVPLIH